MRTFPLPAIALVAFSQACVGDSPMASSPIADGGDPGIGSADAGVDGATTRELEVVVAPIELVRGQPAAFTLNLRWLGPPVDISVAVVGPPGSSSSGPVTIPQGTTAQTINLGTAETLGYGDQIVQFTATGAGIPTVQVSAVMFVRGTPGALDTSFGDQGRAVPPAGEPLVSGIAPDADGKFHAWGLTPAGLVLARYGDDGRLDTSFASGGVGQCAPPPGLSIANFLFGFSTTRAGSGYETAYQFSGPTSTQYALRAVQPDEGACVVLPTTLPASTAHGQGMPQGDGIIWVTNTSDGVKRFDAQGNVDPVWAAGNYLMIPPEGVGADTVVVQLVSASPTPMLLRGYASQGATSLWRGLSVLDRSNGQQIARFASDATAKLGAGTAPDGTSYIYRGSASFLRIDPDGTQADLTSTFYLLETEVTTTGAMAFTPDSSPVLLLTDDKTQLERVVMLDKSLSATQPTINIEAPHVVEDSMLATGAIVDAKRRIIVLHFYDDDAQDPSIVSAHWMIRRYWL